MNKLTKNYIYNLLYQLFVLFVPIVTAPYLARTLGPESQGISSYVVSVSNVVSSVTLLGIYNYGNRQIAYERDNPKKMSQTFLEVLYIRFILGFVGCVIYIILALLLKDYTKYFLIYSVWLIASYLDCTWVYVGLEDMKPPVVKNFIAKLLTVVGIFILIKRPEDVSLYLFLLGASVLVANLLAYTQLNKYVSRCKVDASNFASHIKGSLQLFLPTVATLIYLQVDKIMIEALTKETSQVSFYDNAEKIVTIPLTFITVLSTVMMPRIANEFQNKRYENIQAFLIKAGKISLYLAFPMTTGLIGIAGCFVPWYLGSQYLPVIAGIMIIAPIVIGNSLEGISGKQYFTATNQINVLIKAYFSTAILNVVINALLIPKFGFIGAAIATVISSYICVAIQYFELNKQMKMAALIPCAIKYFLFSAIMYGVIALITTQLKPNPISTIVQVIVGGLVYVLLSAITRDEVFLEMLDKGLKMLRIRRK